MDTTATLTFDLEHEGRGGTLRISDGVRHLDCAIEMVEAGRFAVHLLGAEPSTGRLIAPQREAVRAALRQWLDETDRSDWTIEG